MRGLFFSGSVLAALMVSGALAPLKADEMKADEARRFVAGKMFAFNCFDGSRGAGRIYHDGSVAGSIQFGGSGPTRYVRLPSNTLQVRGDNVCASLKGLPFEPCFNLDKTSDSSFRGSVSGMGFASCTFTRHGQAYADAGGVHTRARARKARHTGTTATARAEPVSLNLRPTSD